MVMVVRAVEGIDCLKKLLTTAEGVAINLGKGA